MAIRTASRSCTCSAIPGASASGTGAATTPLVVEHERGVHDHRFEVSGQVILVVALKPMNDHDRVRPGVPHTVEQALPIRAGQKTLGRAALRDGGAASHKQQGAPRKEQRTLSESQGTPTKDQATFHDSSLPDKLGAGPTPFLRC